jgi:hypothetical protein
MQPITGKDKGEAMIPAGPERDKRIAELRGEHWHEDGVIYCEVDGMKLLWGCAIACSCGNTGYIWHRGQKINDKGEWDYAVNRINEPMQCESIIKPYSTDISAAMELWGEMREAGIKPWLCNVDKIVLCTTADKDSYREATTEADAISGAWLKWREG